MRKLPAVFAVLGLTAVGLAGCAIPAGYETCSRPASDSTATDFVTVDGATGEEPDVSVRSPFHVDSTAFEDIEVGTGPAITSASQALVLDLKIVSGETGEELISTAYDGDLSRVASFARWSEALPGLESTLQCATEGSRVVVALAPGDIEAQTAASLGLQEDDSAVAVVDLQKVYLPRAQGSLVYNDALGLPTVVRAPDGRPGIIVPDATPPGEVVAQTLIKGSGQKVAADDTVRLQYTSVSWDDRSVLENTWESESASTTLEQLVPGAYDALGEVTVGSQLMVVLPSSDGSDGGSPGTTRVYVIDVLGVDEAPAG